MTEYVTIPEQQVPVDELRAFQRSAGIDRPYYEKWTTSRDPIFRMQGLLNLHLLDVKLPTPIKVGDRVRKIGSDHRPGLVWGVSPAGRVGVAWSDGGGEFLYQRDQLIRVDES
jgi:hypothetical protein